ncbi:Glycosyltransferase involved in cell wall bisynthesis [Cyclobacterium xiamenense]|uniref:Glycosyltransferase involved in cell wall bisynthesis n=1 Tax=Cyclobacterium xiamenense TaxID=1297121 RepID=A0A1H7A2I5_9BACT|nr:glycosyltransferase family 4 protein [Cyclobacterium xiamenense]SEJ58117.1 Glycosyltransferase involved in cell wall bisynthesis [Cyclobacterium xiamenense]
MKKKNLLFVTPFFPSFVRSDIQLLQETHAVRINRYPWQHKALAPLFFFLQFFSVLYHIFRTDAVLISFGGYWSVWPAVFGKLFRKKTLIILHGTDCASIPELGYGSLRIPLLKMACGLSYRYASDLVPVSESLAGTELDFDPAIRNRFQGIRHHFPAVTTPIHAVHNGFDPDAWPFEQVENKAPGSFLAVMSAAQYRLKGGDLIAAVAPSFPEYQFTIVGMDAPETTHPVNLRFVGKVPQAALARLYRQNRYYLQLSSFEGFGCALAEAMLSGCIPIGSSVNHIPAIIGNNGFVLSKKDPGMLRQLILQLVNLTDPEKWALNARRHIIASYSLAFRKQELTQLLHGHAKQT